MTDPISIIILTTLAITFIQVFWRLRRENKYFTIFSSYEELQAKLAIIRQYKGFADENGLDNESLDIRVSMVNPYTDAARLSFLIFVPKHVLDNANYRESQHRLEDIFRVIEDD